MKRYDFEYRRWDDFYYVVDRRRGVLNPSSAMARCAKVDDAEKIVDALNAAEAPA